MPHCYKCKTTKELTEFCKDRTRSSGLSSKCKLCMKDRRIILSQKDSWKAKRVEDSRKWKRANKLKEQAHKAVARAVKSGKLAKPKHCPKCGRKDKIEGHHTDYKQRLVVAWLCKNCHLDHHGRKYASR